MLKSMARAYMLRLRGKGDRELTDDDVSAGAAAVGARGNLSRAGDDREHVRLDLIESAVLGEVLGYSRERIEELQRLGTIAVV